MELRQELILFEGFASSSPIGLFIVQSGKFRYTNPMFEKILGYNKDELIGTDALSYVYLEDRDRVRENAVRMLKNENQPGYHPYKYRAIHKSGEIKWIMETVISVQYFGKRAVLGNSMDITELKRAEYAINDYEENFRRSMEDSPVGIRIVDTEGKALFINRALLDMWGYDTIEELEATPRWKRYTPEDYLAHQYRVRKRQRGEYVPLEYEICIVRKDGKIRYLSVSRRGIVWNGSPQYQVIYLDITERKQAEEALKERERRLKEAQALGKIGSWEIDFKTHSVTWSDEMFRLAERDLLAGQPSYDEINQIYIPRASLSLDIPYFTQIFENGEEIHQDTTAHLPSGRTAFLHITGVPVKDRSGKVVKVIGTVQDITEHRKSELQVKTQKALTDRVLASIPNAVAVIGQNRQIIMVNRAFEQTFHLTKDETENTVIEHIIPTAPLVDAVIQVLTSGKSKYQVESRIKQETRERLLVTDIISMQKNEALAVFRDVTEEREIQDRLYLTDRLASVGEMAAGIAHELNNPLTGVIALSELLLDGEIPEGMKEDLESISQEGQRAAGVVKNLLAFARKHIISPQPTEINAVIKEVLKLRAYEHKVSNIEVITHFNPDLPEIVADRFQMQQVFLNIVLNAEQAMIESHGRGTFVITTKLLEDCIKISFADDGPGIPPEIVNRIFDPFFTTKEVGKGTGLGLSICYGIITKQGGKIYTQSNKSTGATFIIELPINPSKMEPA